MKRSTLKRRFFSTHPPPLSKYRLMRNAFSFLIAMACVSATGTLMPAATEAQLAQAADDYKHDRPFQYAPSDPWTRSRLFNQHIKHAGWFYNCDGEQCKRNSPYIFWKTHHENDLPAATPWWQRVNQTVAEVKQRIADGGCADGNCRPAQATCSSCETCSAGRNGSLNSAALPIPGDHHSHLACQSPSLSGSIAKAAPPNHATDAPPINKPLQPKNALQKATRNHPAIVKRTAAVPRNAGLESLDTRIKNR